ncbi:nuclear transport factor 2 family protein [Subtercola endophyticus]|uniref:nuclear transport factor 2 family protein n=1 Tax=Subtercola endophyticus TaxID=2895559 RepID=UPI001E39D585|nr:nuclear transport factor 2 family protein [Subtercola endophyticus]UFS58616.1 nuclear transport factor 2 family protein [Subtercola endophyticus]
MAEKTIEERLQVLEDREAIARLSYDYGLLCDTGYPVQQIVDMFTDDGAWVSNILGEFYGKAELTSYYTNIPTIQVWARHHLVNPVIDVDGDEATCRFFMDVVSTQAGRDGAPNVPIILTATEHVSLRRTPEGWRFVRFDVDIHQMSSLEKGWVAEPYYIDPALSGPSQG